MCFMAVKGKASTAADIRELDAYPLVQTYGSKCESHSLLID